MCANGPRGSSPPVRRPRGTASSPPMHPCRPSPTRSPPSCFRGLRVGSLPASQRGSSCYRSDTGAQRALQALQLLAPPALSSGTKSRPFKQGRADTVPAQHSRFHPTPNPHLPAERHTSNSLCCKHPEDQLYKLCSPRGPPGHAVTERANSQPNRQEEKKLKVFRELLNAINSCQRKCPRRLRGRHHSHLGKSGASFRGGGIQMHFFFFKGTILSVERGEQAFPEEETK